MFKHITDVSQIVPELRHILVTTKPALHSIASLQKIQAEPIKPYGMPKHFAIQRGTYHKSVAKAMEEGIVLEVDKGRHIDLIDVAAFIDNNNLV